MSSNIPLGPGPEVTPIDDFFKFSIQDILTSTSEQDFTKAFNALFATHATFVLNGASVSRDKYKAALKKQSAVQEHLVHVTVTLQQSVVDQDSHLKVGHVQHPGVAAVTYQVTQARINPGGPVIEGSNQEEGLEIPLFENAANFVVKNNNTLGDERQIVEINHVIGN